MDLLKVLTFQGENNNSLEYNIGCKAKSEPDSKNHKKKSGRINTLICEKRTLETHEKCCNGYKASTSELKDEKAFQCTICSYKTKSKKALRRHRKTHVISNTLVFEGDNEKLLNIALVTKSETSKL